MNPTTDSYRFDLFTDDLCEFAIGWSDAVQRHIAARARELYDQPVARQLVRSWAEAKHEADGKARRSFLWLVKGGESDDGSLSNRLSASTLAGYQRVLIDLLVSPALKAKVDALAGKEGGSDACDQVF